VRGLFLKNKGVKIMPAIVIHSLELTDEQKEVVADKFITILSELTKVPKDRIYLFFNGYTLDNAACDGILFSKRPPKVAIGKFSQKKEGE
jgi:phenylpyruvate tautomerase PptA (4-oxalocrotonate tautomerase family)